MKNSNDETSELIDNLRDRMAQMEDSQRLEIMRRLTQGYCTKCGSDRLPCYCERDE